MPAAPTAVRQDKYSCDKNTFGGITFLTMHGTLNETFEGQKAASAIRTKKVLINMADIRRFASWGMSEWMDFLRITSDCDLYLVECSTYAVSQLNLVTGLLGHSKLVSFYASYRCGSCSEEMQTLFLIPRDRGMIPEIPGSQQECATCGGRARLEEYPAAFFDAIAARPAFDIDDEALAFMRTHLNYDLSPDLTRFRAFRRKNKANTYIRVTGNIATMPADLLARATEGTTVLDLEGVVFDPHQLNPWRSYLQAATSKAKSLQLLACPPGFLGVALMPDDFRDKLKVRTFLAKYTCGTCDTISQHVIDVALNLEQLVTGVLPSVRCPSCHSTLTAPLTENHARIVRALPARDRDVVLDNFLAKVRTEPNDKLDNCLVATATPMPVAPSGGRRNLYIALGGVVALAALGGVGWKLLNREESHVSSPIVYVPSSVNNQPQRPTFTRPDWIISDVPSSGYCHDMINRLMCVGVSAYRVDRDDAIADANDAALDELVNTVSLKIVEPTFRDRVIPAYSDVRNKALTALQTAQLKRNEPKSIATYAAADDVVRKARRRVVAALQASGGPAVPAQRSDWYWEEYAGEVNGTATEFLVFIRYDISLDAMRALVDKYSATTAVAGSTAMTAFPALGWSRASFTGGAYLAKVSDRLAHAGIAANAIVTAVGGQRITDASELARQLDPHSGEVKLSVATNAAADQVIAVKP